MFSGLAKFAIVGTNVLTMHIIQIYKKNHMDERTATFANFLSEAKANVIAIPVFMRISRLLLFSLLL
jgi:hypothetical protein